MTTRLSPGKWIVVWNRRRRWWEIRDGNGEAIAIGYDGKPDAEVMAASKRLYVALKALIRAKPYSQAYVAALNAAQALVDELNGGK